MDIWVRSEYAGELAVLSAWLTALLPWSIGYTPSIAGGRLLDVRFPLVHIRYTFGIPISEAVTIRDPITAYGVSAGPVTQAYVVWLLAAVPVLLALALSAAYYLREERVESTSVDPVRVMGALLLAAGLGFLVGSGLFFVRHPGVTFPVGALIILVLGGSLLVVDRAEFDDQPADSEPESEEAADGA